MTEERHKTSTTVDEACRAAEEITDSASFHNLLGNEFWVVLPDGAFSDDAERGGAQDESSAFTIQSMRDAILTFLVLIKDAGVLTDAETGRKLLLKFEPGPSLPPRNPAKRKKCEALEKKDAEAKKPAVPDVGELLAELSATRKSLSAIDAVLQAEGSLDALGKDGQSVSEVVAATRDRAVMGLEQLSLALSTEEDLSDDAWREGVRNALDNVIQAMLSFKDINNDALQVKAYELEALKGNVSAFLGGLNRNDAAEIQQFSSGVNGVILKDRQEDVFKRKGKLEASVAKEYECLVAALNEFVRQGGNIYDVLRPSLEPGPGCFAKLVFNMAHVVMLTRYGSLAIDLKVRSQTLHSQIQGIRTTPEPRVYFVSKSRFLAVQRPRPPVFDY